MEGPWRGDKLREEGEGGKNNHLVIRESVRNLFSGCGELRMRSKERFRGAAGYKISRLRSIGGEDVLRSVAVGY